MKLIETIRFEKGNFQSLAFHQQRMNQSRKELLDCDDEIELFSILHEKLLKEDANSYPPRSRFYGFLNCNQAIAFRKHIEAENENLRSSGFAIRTQNDADLQSAHSGIFKCRIIYAKQIEKIEFIPYQIPDIHSLKIITDNDVDYKYKYHDRSQLEKLFSTKGKYDDILIVKNGLITDTYSANVLFYDGTDWLTPSQPLLKGTQRESLLQKGMIKTVEIRIPDLEKFQKVRLVNAMIRFEDELEIGVGSLAF